MHLDFKGMDDHLCIYNKFNMVSKWMSSHLTRPKYRSPTHGQLILNPSEKKLPNLWSIVLLVQNRKKNILLLNCYWERVLNIMRYINQTNKKLWV